jgi:hypothetical protein
MTKPRPFPAGRARDGLRCVISVHDVPAPPPVGMPAALDTIRISISYMGCVLPFWASASCMAAGIGQISQTEPYGTHLCSE